MRQMDVFIDLVKSVSFQKDIESKDSGKSSVIFGAWISKNVKEAHGACQPKPMGIQRIISWAALKNPNTIY